MTCLDCRQRETPPNGRYCHRCKVRRRRTSRAAYEARVVRPSSRSRESRPWCDLCLASGFHRHDCPIRMEAINGSP